MNTLVDRLAERPRPQRMLMGLGVLVIIALAMWQFLVSPVLVEYQSLRSAVLKNDNQIVVEQKVAAQLESVKVSLSELEARLREMREQLADKSQVDDLLHNVSASAQEAGLDLKLFQRKEENAGSFYAEIPVAVSVSGGFHAIASFFDTVNHLPGLVAVDRFSFSSPKGAEERTRIHVDFVVTAHRLLTEAERERLTAPKKP